MRSKLTSNNIIHIGNIIFFNIKIAVWYASIHVWAAIKQENLLLILFWYNILDIRSLNCNIVIRFTIIKTSWSAKHVNITYKKYWLLTTSYYTSNIWFSCNSAIFFFHTNYLIWIDISLFFKLNSLFMTIGTLE